MRFCVLAPLCVLGLCSPLLGVTQDRLYMAHAATEGHRCHVNMPHNILHSLGNMQASGDYALHGRTIEIDKHTGMLRALHNAFQNSNARCQRVTPYVCGPL